MLPPCVPAEPESGTRFAHTVTCRSNHRPENMYIKMGVPHIVITPRSALR
jgi:hypothetical protein